MSCPPSMALKTDLCATSVTEIGYVWWIMNDKQDEEQWGLMFHVNYVGQISNYALWLLVMACLRPGPLGLTTMLQEELWILCTCHLYSLTLFLSYPTPQCCCFLFLYVPFSSPSTWIDKHVVLYYWLLAIPWLTGSMLWLKLLTHAFENRYSNPEVVLKMSSTNS